MTTTPRTGRPTRGGFTLLELLVVIGIMVLIAALAVGTYFRIQDAQTVKATEDRMRNLNAGLNRLWSAEVDAAKQEFDKNEHAGVPTVLAICGGDRDRARSLWAYLRLKNNFPQTFAEANSNFVYRVSGFPDVTFQKNKAFAGLSVASNRTVPIDPVNPRDPKTPGGQEAAKQAAVILRLILIERASRGETYGDEATGSAGGEVELPIDNNNPPTPAKFRVFNDMWGTPIAFVRWGWNAELQAAPYTRTGAASQDPLDPRGKLGGTWTNKLAAANALFKPTFPGGGAPRDQAVPAFPSDLNSAAFTGQYWIPTVFSAGSDKVYDTDVRWVQSRPEPTPPVPPATPLPGDGLVPVTVDSDDILGYRLRREGQRGD